MLFDDAVESIRTRTDLRRIAGAHVVDHRQLDDDELRAAITKAKPQYLHEATVRANVEQALFREARNDTRVLSRLILVDVLLDQYDFFLQYSQTEEKVIAFEQSIVDNSNEINIIDLASGNRHSHRYRNIELYDFVLSVAWDNENTKSPDEVNLLRKLRERLGITEFDHRLLEAKLGKYPKPLNQLHTRAEIVEVRRHLQSFGLVFGIRQDDGVDIDVIPQELALVLRSILRVETRTDSYRELLSYRPLRRKALLTDALERVGLESRGGDTIDVLAERVLRYVPPTKAIASSSPRYGLNSEQLSVWCRELGIPTSGTIEERVGRIIEHYDQLRPRIESTQDERAEWYEFYEELAAREHDVLRAQHVVEKDLEIEAKFERATGYLFAKKLNHTPLQQRGSNHPDGLLSLQASYLMRDNKSKEGPVNLREHLSQFDGYMNQADKPVPVFLVIAPDFTEESQAEAVRYHAQHFERNIALISAKELKLLAEEWSSKQNKNRDEPFPLGLLAATGRYNRSHLGELP